MNQRLVVSIAMAALLAACSAKPVKEEPPAAVVDKSPATQTAAKPVAPKAAESATAAPVTESASKVNPLTDPNNILSKRSVYFDFDKDEVKAEYRAMVEAHAKYLVANPNARATLQGNADERGSREYNLALGQRRAAAVKKVMNVYGASDNQIETVSYGEEKARCTAQTEACFAENRRADIVYAGE
jgi:peptidoglycan-associated lipoprotein